MKFKAGDIIDCSGVHFSEREVLSCIDGKYITKFLEDGSIVESESKIIDAHYWLK